MPSVSWILRIHLDTAEASSELATTLMWDAGTTGVFEKSANNTGGCEIVAGFETEQASHRGARMALERLGEAVLSYSVAPYHYGGNFEPTPVHIPSLDEPMEIVAGTLFGHGNHPTTEIALELLAKRISPGSRVLDVGSGSGVLALAAKLLGAEAVTAIEIDADAIEVVTSNLARNGLPPNAVDLRIGSVENLHDMVKSTPRFDVVVANVLSPVHRLLAPRLAPLLARGASVITSGTLTTDDREIEGLYRRFLPPVTKSELASRPSASETIAWRGFSFLLDAAR